MKPIILGTAGHIDHGKTALVKALTGVDTDRLPEEKARGITIDLGFAQMDLEDGVRAGVVDVPGHERFVKNMLAGAGGVDLVMLVVAADEGVMPQTREHLSICRLLGVKEGLVVLTKRDLAEPDWLALVRDDVADLVRGTFLEGKPVVAVSSKTGEGLEDLRGALAELARGVTPKSESGLFRLPVDRVFTMRGFGAVVTGTLFSGQVRVGDRACIYPARKEARVRGLQVHGETTERAWAGMRTAVNLQGVEKAEVTRGDVLGHPSTLKPTFMLDVSLEHLADAPHPLRTRARVRFHAGTCEVMARAHLIGREALEPGERGYAQLRLEAPVALLPGDRFVVRSYSPMVTIGGGAVLDVLPPKHRPMRAEARERLSRLEGADDRARLLLHLEEAGAAGLAAEDLVGRLPLGAGAVRELTERLAGEGTLVAVDWESGWAVGREAFEALRRDALAALAEYHRANPLRPGMPREELRGRLGGPGSEALPERVFAAALESLSRAGRVAAEEGNIRLASHQVQVGPRMGELKERLEGEFRLARFQPPSPEEAFEKLGMKGPRERELLQVLVDEKALVRVKENILYHRSALEEARAMLEAYLRAHGQVAASQFRDLLGITRKHAIPLLEYFDAQRVTLRVGDNRVLRNP